MSHPEKSVPTFFVARLGSQAAALLQTDYDNNGDAIGVDVQELVLVAMMKLQAQ